MKALVFLIALVMAMPAHAQRTPLVLDLAENHVDITTGFSGTNLIVYGVRQGSNDVIIELRGPDRTMVVRRKGSVLGAWINVQSVEYHRVPGYFDYARTAPIRNMPDEIRHRFGLSGLDFYPDERLSDDDARRFREALIRNKQAQALFPLQGREMQILPAGLFKVAFPLPDNIPTGIYRVNAYLVDGARVTAEAQKTLQVGQVGFSAQVYKFAHDHAWLYALLAIGLALFAGWGAFTFLRRD